MESTPRIQQGDRQTPAWPGFLPVTLVLDNLRSAFNVGNIFRLAEATRIERIVTCGCTATPPHPKLARTARGCAEHVPCTHVASATEAVTRLRSAGCTVYGVETAEEVATVWDVSFRFPAVFVFGNEALGVSHDVLPLCHGFVSLPCLGTKNSVNVGNCAAVVLYQVLRQCMSGGMTGPIAGHAPKPGEEE